MDVLERVLVSTTTQRSPTPVKSERAEPTRIVRMQQLQLMQI